MKSNFSEASFYNIPAMRYGRRAPKQFFCILGALLLMGLAMHAQQRVITGRVTGSDNAPLPNVNVLVQQTRIGAVTDNDGRYRISLSAGDKVLLFSAVGFKTARREINGSTVIDVVLQTDQTQLEGVVVVGYGTQKKRDLTGAIGTVSGKRMENNAVTSVGQALQGKVAGVQVTQNNGGPGAGVEIRVRGWGTFGNTFPLIVVDGIITNYGLNDLNPNDIEDITVLKDASAAAIYGSRGANGVVLVTTRRGKEGRTRIDFSTYYSVDEVIHKIPTVHASEYAQMVNEYYSNAGKAPPFENPASYGKGTNWQDEIFRTGSKQDYALSVSGGTQKNLYALSIGYYKGEGIVVNSKYDRGTFRINNDMELFKGMKAGSSIGISYSASKGGNAQQAIDLALIYAPTVKPYNEKGVYGIADKAGEPTTMTQPLVAAYERNNKELTIRGLGSLYAEYEIVRGLKFRSSIGLEYYNFDKTYFVPSYSYGLGNTNTTASLTRNTYNNKNWMWDNILTYTASIGKVHDIDVLAGYTFQDSRYETLNGYREGFSRNGEAQQVLDAGSQKDLSTGYYNNWTMQSYLGRISYSYKNRYLLTSNLRIDQSSRFARHNRTGVFPSVSAGWVVSEEPFADALPDAISFLKLRASYGLLGNQDIGVYPYQSTVSSGLNYSLAPGQNVMPGYAPTSLANEDIKWEQTATNGVGLELNLFRDRLRLVADYYNRLTTDVLVQIPLPALSGFGTYPYQNAASVRNRGLEFTLEYGNAHTKKDFTYTLGFNLAVNRNRVMKLSRNADIIYWDARTVQGHEIVEFYGYIQDGIFQTAEEVAQSPAQPNAAPGDMKFRDLNNDKVIDDRDRTFIGSNMPRQVFGFYGTARYRNFDLSISMNGDLGRDRVMNSPGFALTRAAEQTSAMFYDRWTGPGTSNYVPRLVAGDPNTNSRMSTFWVRSQDYLRVKNVQLGYDFPARVLERSRIRRLRIYVAAQNLLTITNYPGYDPELWANIYPLPRSVFAGVNLGF